MHVEINRAFVFYPLLIVCVCLDFFSMFWFGTPVVYSLLALFAVTVSRKTSIIRLSIILAALAFESFLLYWQWGVQLIYLIPIAVIARATWDKFTHPTQHAIIIVTECLIAQILIIDTLVGINLLSIFTVVKFLINILLTISISLTYT
jgi:hypothetical protein